MKRLFLTFVAMLSMTITFAENENANNANAYIMSENVNGLTRYLALNEQQVLDVQDVHTTFCNDMKEASTLEGQARKVLMQVALKRNCMYMKLVLTPEQYTKYLRVLNATINNRGLNK